MGTPEFAVPSLEALVQNNFAVVAVVTAADKPQGRSGQPVASPVKISAVKLGIPVLQPVNLKAPEFQEELKSYRADLQVVVAFRMLPESVWSMPPRGTFNLHASLLPQYRGAAPINWAIINGESETGITTFFLQHEIDTGKILFQEKEHISADDDAGSLYERLMVNGADLVVKTAKAIEAGTYQTQEQQHVSDLRPAPKIFRETCEINWNQSGERIRNFIRGMSPYPAAWTTLNGKVYKIFRSTAITGAPAAAPGTIKTDNKTYLHICCADGEVVIEELQPEGKRRMSTGDFFRGNKIEA
jgi:methionyl-tRNA formyltransferase